MDHLHGLDPSIGTDGRHQFHDTLGASLPGELGILGSLLLTNTACVICPPVVAFLSAGALGVGAGLPGLGGAIGNSAFLVVGWLRPILLGTNLTENSAPAVASYQFIAQRFSLTEAIHVSSINVQMAGFGTDQFTLWLTNAVGPGTTAANVLVEKTATFPNTGGAQNNRGKPISVSADLLLNPGVYYLVTSSMQSGSINEGWFLSPFNAAVPSSVGSFENQRQIVAFAV
jgi:hypothetical protein